MDYVNVLSLFESIDNDSDLGAIFSAMVSCLEPSQACSLFDVSFNQEYRKRMAIIKKISRDIQSQYINCHKELLNRLMESLNTLPSNKRQSCGYCLTYLIEYIPEQDKREIISFFLASQWKPIRNRGYKYLLVNWDNSWVNCIEENWVNWSDFEAARIILEYFPESYLLEHFEVLLQILEGTYFIRKFFFKSSSIR